MSSTCYSSVPPSPITAGRRRKAVEALRRERSDIRWLALGLFASLSVMILSALLGVHQQDNASTTSVLRKRAECPPSNSPSNVADQAALSVPNHKNADNPAVQTPQVVVWTSKIWVEDVHTVLNDQSTQVETSSKALTTVLFSTILPPPPPPTSSTSNSPSASSSHQSTTGPTQPPALAICAGDQALRCCGTKTCSMAGPPSIWSAISCSAQQDHPQDTNCVYSCSAGYTLITSDGDPLHVSCSSQGQQQQQGSTSSTSAAATSTGSTTTAPPTNMNPTGCRFDGDCTSVTGLVSSCSASTCVYPACAQGACTATTNGFAESGCSVGVANQTPTPTCSYGCVVPATSTVVDSVTTCQAPGSRFRRQ